MKKTIASLVAALFAVCNLALADGRVYVYGEAGDYYYGLLNRVSANGRWVVGADDANQSGAYMIDTAAPETLIHVKGGELYDVADDGMAVGAWHDNQGTASEPVLYAHAAVYAGGQWLRLPEPREIIGRSYARCVSPDGRFIAGMAFCYAKDSEVGGKYYPCLWTRDGAGDYALTCYNSLSLPANMGFYTNAMSADGRHIAGTLCTDAGGTVPALVSDGELLCWNKLEVSKWPYEINGRVEYYDFGCVDGIIEGASDDTWFNGSFNYINGDYVFGHRSTASNVDPVTGTGTVTHNRTIYNLSTGTFTDEPSDTWFSSGFDDRHAFIISGITAYYLNDGAMRKVAQSFNIDSPVDIASVYGFDRAGRVFACSFVWFNEVIGEYCESPALVVLDGQPDTPSLYEPSYSTLFDTRIPADVECANLDGGTLQSSAYRSLPDGQPSWYWAKVDGLNAAAVCPTRNADGSTRRSRMTFPPVNVAGSDAILRWDARSMMAQVPESYRVLVRRVDGGDWHELCSVSGENHQWTTRTASLAAYMGLDVQVAFESATPGPDAFMLAIDDVAIGTMRDSKYRFQSTAPHYVTPQDRPAVGGLITNYGADSFISRIVIEATDGTVLHDQAVDLSRPLQTATVELPVTLAVGETLDYRIVAVDASGNRDVLLEDYVACSHFRRTLLMDRLTGTWCNNCPQMALRVAREKARYGDELLVAELHVNGAVSEPLANLDYWNGYCQNNVFAIPQLIVNHNLATVADKPDYAQALRDELCAPTIARIDAEVYALDDELHLTADCQFALDIDNSDDRYRVGYIVLADMHDPDASAYTQMNAAPNATWQEYWFMPDRILPDLAYHDNVVVEASTGVAGIPGSLGAAITARTPISSEHTLSKPHTPNSKLKVVALIIDTADGRIVNCSLARWSDHEEPAFPVTVSPSNESPVQSLSGVVTLTFPTVGNIFMSRKKVYLYDGDGNQMTSADGATLAYTLAMGDQPNELRFTIGTPITADGVYQFVIPAGSLLNDDTNEPLPEIRIAYTVDGATQPPCAWSIEPSLDEPIQQLDGTYTITLLDYAENGITWDTPLCPCNVFVYRQGDDTTGRPFAYFGATVSHNTITFTAYPGVYDAGDYVLNIAGFVDLTDDTEIPPINIPFTLTGGEAPDIPVDPKEPLDQTYTLSPDNTVPMDELSGRIVITFPGIGCFADVGGFPTVTTPSGAQHGAYADGTPLRIRMLKHEDDPEGLSNMAYIDLDAAGLRFTEQGTYTFSIPKFVFHVEGDFDKDYVDPFEFTYTVGRPATVLFEENFDGDYKANFPTLLDGDSQMPAYEIQSLFLSAETGTYMPWWTLRESSASTDRFMGSHSYYSPAGTSDDWLVSRPINIPTRGFMLDFDAQSVTLRTGDRLSDLTVCVTDRQPGKEWRPEGTLFGQVPAGATPDVTTGEWTHYSMPLDEWAGKTVYLCFVNRNTDRDILCIDNIKVFRHEDVEVTLEPIDAYTADEQVAVAATVTPVAADLAGYTCCFRAATDAGVVTIDADQADMTPIMKGDTRTFTASVPLDKCRPTDITFALLPSGDSHAIERTATTVRLAFRPQHRVLIEETTGLWCGNCPIGIYTIESLKEDEGIAADVVPVSVHISGTTTDLMAMDDYGDYLGLARVAPMTRIDRGANAVGFSAGADANYDPSNTASFANRVYSQRDRLALADISIEVTPVAGADADTVAFDCTARVRPAIDLDPDRYRVGFILTENNVGLDGKSYWAQTNYFADMPYTSQLGGWTLLPEKVQNMRYHYVARALPAPSGIPGSFAELNAEEEYTVTATIDIPDTRRTDSKGNVASLAVRPWQCELTAYIVDTRDLSIVNTARTPVTPEALNLFTVRDLLTAVRKPAGDKPAPDAVYDLQGRRANPHCKYPAPTIHSGGRIIVTHD